MLQFNKNFTFNLPKSYDINDVPIRLITTRVIKGKERSKDIKCQRKIIINLRLDVSEEGDFQNRITKRLINDETKFQSCF